MARSRRRRSDRAARAEPRAHVGVARRASLHHEGGRPGYAPGGRAPRIDADQSGIQIDDIPDRRPDLCGHSVDRAGGDCRQPPPYPERSALHHRRGGCLHRGRRRADDHVERRLRPDPCMDLARPRQPVRQADDLARWSRSSLRNHIGCELLRGLCRRRWPDAADLSPIRGLPPPLGTQSAAHLGAAVLDIIHADSELPLERVAGGAACAAHGNRKPIRRHHPPVHQSDDRRTDIADHIRLPAAPARGRAHPVAPSHLQHGLSRGRR